MIPVQLYDIKLINFSVFYFNLFVYIVVGEWLLRFSYWLGEISSKKKWLQWWREKKNDVESRNPWRTAYDRYFVIMHAYKIVMVYYYFSLLTQFSPLLKHAGIYCHWRKACFCCPKGLIKIHWKPFLDNSVHVEEEVTTQQWETSSTMHRLLECRGH